MALRRTFQNRVCLARGRHPAAGGSSAPAVAVLEAHTCNNPREALSKPVQSLLLGGACWLLWASASQLRQACGLPQAGTAACAGCFMLLHLRISPLLNQP